MTNNFGKVAVLYGGTSAERDISLLSGRQVFQGLKEKNIDAHLIDVQSDVVETLQREQFDRAFNILHGRGGEDGTIQAVLEFLGIPYCSSGVAASALAMDKVRSKWVWQSTNIKTPKFCVVKNESDLANVKKQLDLPICIKPVHEGSSNGVSKVTDFSQLTAAYEKAKAFHDSVIAEQWIDGDELTVGIVGDIMLPTVKISTPTHLFYDYDAKYLDHSTIYECPCGLSFAEEKAAQAVSLAAFDALGCKGWGRVDLIKDSVGDFWIIEINTLPGMTSTSLVPKAAKAMGIAFSDLLVKILETSL